MENFPSIQTVGRNRILVYKMNIEESIEKVIRLRIFYDRNLFTNSMRGYVIILLRLVGK